MKWIYHVEYIGWLRENVAVAQFFAYTSLTVTTAIVAVLSLRFSYRQHYGWSPILLLVTRGLKGGGLTDDGEQVSSYNGLPVILAWVTFDLWNRRTYPIVIEDVRVTFTQDILNRKNEGTCGNDDAWILHRDGHHHRNRFVLDNGKHYSFALHAKMKDHQSLDAIDCDIIIKIQYFDPRRRKSLQLTLREPYNFHPAKRSLWERVLGR